MIDYGLCPPTDAIARSTDTSRDSKIRQYKENKLLEERLKVLKEYVARDTVDEETKVTIGCDDTLLLCCHITGRGSTTRPLSSSGSSRSMLTARRCKVTKDIVRGCRTVVDCRLCLCAIRRDTDPRQQTTNW